MPPFASAGFLHHEGHHEHEDFSFLDVLMVGLYYGVATSGVEIDGYLAIHTMHLKWV